MWTACEWPILRCGDHDCTGLDPRRTRCPVLDLQLTGLEAFYALFGLSAETAESAARLNALMELPEVQAALQARQDMSQQGVQMRTTAPVPH